MVKTKDSWPCDGEMPFHPLTFLNNLKFCCWNCLRPGVWPYCLGLFWNIANMTHLAGYSIRKIEIILIYIKASMYIDSIVDLSMKLANGTITHLNLLTVKPGTGH